MHASEVPARPSGLRPATEARRVADAERQVTPVTRLSIPSGTATALAAGFALVLAACEAPSSGGRRATELRLLGAGAVLGLAVVITFADIARIANGESLFR